MESTANDDRTSKAKAIALISRIIRERQDKIFPSLSSSSSDEILDRAAHRAAESICDRSLDPSPAGASRIMDEVARETLLVEDGWNCRASETAARARRLGSSVAMALLSEAAFGSAASDLAGFVWVPEPAAIRGPAEGDGDGEEGGDVYMNDVREYCEEYPVQLSTRASSYFSPNALGPGHPGGEVAIKDGPRWVVRGRNEGGHNATEIDLVDLLRWLSWHRGDMLASFGILLGDRDRIARDVRAEIAGVLGAEFGSSARYEPVEEADVERIVRSVNDGVMRCLASPALPSPYDRTSMSCDDLDRVRSEVGRIRNMSRESLISELVDCATNWVVEYGTDLDPGYTGQGPSAIRDAYRSALGALP